MCYAQMCEIKYVGNSLYVWGFVTSVMTIGRTCESIVTSVHHEYNISDRSQQSWPQFDTATPSEASKKEGISSFYSSEKHQRNEIRQFRNQGICTTNLHNRARTNQLQ